MTAILPTTIGLGRLVDLIIRDAHGQRLRLTPQGESWLAWKPETRDLVVLRPGRGRVRIAKRGDAARHKRFHGIAPEHVRPMEWPIQHGVVRTLGLIESVTYTAVGIASPSKGAHHWVHQFGDRGEYGHGRARAEARSPYSEHLMPRLDLDATGNIVIVRRSGNTFTVHDWILA